MIKRKEVLNYGLSFADVYVDTPFRDTNWVLLRYRKNKKAFGPMNEMVIYGLTSK